jgi:L-malate glycosyltransferase
VDSARSWRGGQNQVLLTASGMAARGHAVALACRKNGVLCRRASTAGGPALTVRGLGFAGDLSPFAVLGLVGLLRELRPEIVHAHDPHALGAALLAVRVLRGPRLLASRRVDFTLRGPLSRRKYRACARVIAASQAIARILQADGLPPGRLRVVHEGVLDRPPRGGGREALRALGVPPDAPVVGNVAALVDHKDHPTLLAAASQVVARRPDVRFVIVGTGERGDALRAQAHALRLDGHVVWAGFREDLDALIPVFTVFCLSSHLEGLGTSLLDAMAFRRPVVATAAGGIVEAVEDGVTGRLVPPRDPEALAAALLELLEDPDRAAQMGHCGRRRFEERFTADRMVAETLAVYAEALATGAEPA